MEERGLQGENGGGIVELLAQERRLLIPGRAGASPGRAPTVVPFLVSPRAGGSSGAVSGAGLQPHMMCKETSMLALSCPRWAQLVLSLVLN